MTLYGRAIKNGGDSFFVFHADHKMIDDRKPQLDTAVSAWLTSTERKRGKSLVWFLERLGYGVIWNWGETIEVKDERTEHSDVVEEQAA